MIFSVYFEDYSVGHQPKMTKISSKRSLSFPQQTFHHSMFTRRLHVSLKYCSCQQLADHVINEKDNRMLKLFEHNNRNFICISSEHVCLLPSAYNVPGNIHDVQLRCVRLVICKSLLRRSILLISQ